MICPPGKSMSFHKKETEKIKLVARPATQLFSVDFSQSKIGAKKCVFNKPTIKVCVSSFLTVSLGLHAQCSTPGPVCYSLFLFLEPTHEASEWSETDA